MIAHIISALTVLGVAAIASYTLLAFAARYDRSSLKAVRADLERYNRELREALLAAEADYARLVHRVDKLSEGRNARAAAGMTGGRIA